MQRTLGSILTSRDQIAARVAELSAEISRDYAGLEPTFLIVLKGAGVFGADLARAMSEPVRLDYLPATSYRGTWSSGAVSIGPLQPAEIFDRHVIIIEDITDTGATLKALWGHVHELAPASLEVCTFLDKSAARGVEPVVPIRYVGFPIPDRFVVGYGMDLDEQFRDLPDIHFLE